jgi:DNA-directed RNA polymerase specialized sigma24 family protein
VSDDGPAVAARAAAVEDHGYELSELRIDLVWALRRAPVQQRRAVMLRFGRGQAQARHRGRARRSQMQVSRMLREALTTVRAALEPSGDRSVG